MNNNKTSLPNFIMLLLLGCSGARDSKPRPQAIENIPLDGIWAENAAANPLFTISGSTITGYEQGDRTHLKVVGDTVLIYYEEFVGKYLILKHTTDSLILRKEDGSVTRLYRR